MDSKQCFKALTVGSKSPDNSVGLSITWAPYLSAISLILSSSVETKIASITFMFFWAYIILCAINGIPSKSSMFLFGNLLEPPRAGIIAIFFIRLVMP